MQFAVQLLQPDVIKLLIQAKADVNHHPQGIQKYASLKGYHKARRLAYRRHAQTKTLRSRQLLRAMIN